MPTPGEVISGKYRVIRLIGDGGMGSVYEAEHQMLGNRVALKFLHPELAHKESLKQRFLQEARVSASIKNPHIVQVSDFGTADDGTAFLVMELLEGETLQAAMEREHRLDVGRTIWLTLLLLEGLGAAHARGIVHRDLKPDNVFLVPGPWGEVPKILDFGIAKLRQSEDYQITLTRPGSVMGTPEYMAPEQAFSADQVDQRGDIYSLGVMLFEMLSGQLPAEGETPQQIAEQVITGRAKKLAELKPELDPRLVRIVERAMMPNPDDRYSNIDELRAQLLPVAEGMHLEGLNRLSMVDSQLLNAGRPAVSIPIEVDGDFDPAQRRTELSDGPAPIPSTVPPDTDAPPRASALPPGGSSTAAMPARMNAPAVGPTDPGPIRTRAAVHRRRSSNGGLIALLSVVVLGAAAAGAAYYYSAVYLPSTWPPEPPQPTRRAVAAEATGTSQAAEPPVADEEPAPDWTPAKPLPRANVPAAPAATASTGPEEPRRQTIPEAIATALPAILPSGFPTAFPTTFPTAFPPIPGLTPPSPAPSASASAP